MGNDLSLGILLVLRDSFSANAARASAEMKNLSGAALRTAEDLQLHIGRMQSLLTSAGRNILGGMGIAAGLSHISKEAGAFNSAMAEVNTILPRNSANFAAFREEVLRTSGIYGKDPVDHAHALYQTISSGHSTLAGGKAILESASSLAMVGLTETKIAAEGLSNIINAYKMKDTDAGALADKLFAVVRGGRVKVGTLTESIGQASSVAALAHIPIDDLLASYGAMTLTGLKPTQVAQYQRQIIMGLSRPTNSALAAAKKVRYTDEKGKFHKGFELSKNAMDRAGGLSPYLWRMVMASGGFKTEDDGSRTIKNFAEFAKMIPGRQGFAGAAALMQNYDKQRMLLEQIKHPYFKDEFGFMTSDRQVAEAMTFDTRTTQIARFHTALKKLAITLGSSVEPAFVGLLKGVNGFVNGVTWLLGHVPLLSKALMLTGVAAAVTLIGSGLGKIFTVITDSAFLKMLSGGLGTAPGLATIGALASGLMLVVAALGAVRYAYGHDLFGLRTTVANLVMLKHAFSDAFQHPDGAGGWTVGADSKSNLQQAGLLGTFTTMLALLTRLQAAWIGFKNGFNQVMHSVTTGITGAVGAIGRAIPGLGFLARWADRMTFNPSSISAMVHMGAAIGRLAAGITALWVAGKALNAIGGIMALFGGGSAGGAAAKGSGAGFFASGFRPFTNLPFQAVTMAKGFWKSFWGVGMIDVAARDAWLAAWAKAAAKTNSVDAMSKSRQFWTFWTGQQTRLLANAPNLDKIGWGAQIGLWLQGLPGMIRNGFVAAAAAMRAGIALMGAAFSTFGATVRTGGIVAAFRGVGTTIAARISSGFLAAVASWPLLIGGAIFAAISGALLYVWHKQDQKGTGGPQSKGERTFGGGMPDLNYMRTRLGMDPLTKTMGPPKGYADYMGVETFDAKTHPGQDALRELYTTIMTHIGREKTYANEDPAAKFALKQSQANLSTLTAYARKYGIDLAGTDGGVTPPPPPNLPPGEVDLTSAVAKGTRRGINDAAHDGSFIFDKGDEQTAKHNPYQQYLDMWADMAGAKVGGGPQTPLEEHFDDLKQSFKATAEGVVRSLGGLTVQMDSQTVGKILQKGTDKAAQTKSFGIPSVVHP